MLLAKSKHSSTVSYNLADMIASLLFLFRRTQLTTGKSSRIGHHLGGLWIFGHYCTALHCTARHYHLMHDLSM
jgi:hypothetical protein